MLPFQNYNRNYMTVGSKSNRNGPVQLIKNESDGGDWRKKSSSSTSTEASIMKQHAIAEQKRRKRINDHIRTLRQLLIPNTTSKTVKALVLAEAVRQIKELKKRADDVALQQNGDICSGGSTGSNPFMFPGESDEATVISYFEEGYSGEGKMVKVMVCCEDRPDLNRELAVAIRSARGRAVRAEMATVGGRTKAEVVVELPEDGGGGEVDVGSLRRALKAVLENRALACSNLGHMMSITRPNGLGLETRVSKQGLVSSSIDNGWVDGLSLRSM